MSKKYVIALDQGTTSSRTVLFNEKGKIDGISQKETKQIYPKNGWVEQNALDIYKNQLQTFKDVIKDKNIDPSDVVAIGITNQRETTIVWNKKTGRPIYNAIIWQDVRTTSICKELKEKGLDKYVKENTGLVIDSYFSATKIKWI
ncbi:MAG: glycerol kinase, partial [Flavobacteriaceae bacterium]|nr:glycerol kinase [Flavobacteriaceae bacterium]